MENRNFAFFASACCSLILLASPVVWGQSSGSQGAVIEQIVARVNNEIITLSDYQKAAVGLREEVQQDCQNCTPDQIQTELRDRLKNLLRDMIDQQLLIERAKDMDVNVETDLVKRLDQVRKDNNLATMEELEKAVESQGIVWEDYKTQLRNGLLTQEVIRKEVGGRMDIGSDEVKKYYEAHKQDFNRPEQVELGELFLNTEGKSRGNRGGAHQSGRFAQPCGEGRRLQRTREALFAGADGAGGRGSRRLPARPARQAARRRGFHARQRRGHRRDPNENRL